MINWDNVVTQQDKEVEEKSKLINRVAAIRYENEIRGIEVNGVTIDTGRDSQSLITGAALSAMLDPEYSVRFKSTAGFITLTGQEVIGIATAIRQHVQSCFDREDTILAAIEDGTFSEDMLTEGW